MGSLAAGVTFNHIARETNDVARLAQFYEEILGFQRIESPKYDGMEVVWLRLGPSFSLHVVERKPGSDLPLNPRDGCSDPSNLPRQHHVAFAVSNFESFVQGLKDKGIESFQKTQPDGRTRQAFFFDPDVTICGSPKWRSVYRLHDQHRHKSNGVEVMSCGTPQ